MLTKPCPVYVEKNLNMFTHSHLLRNCSPKVYDLTPEEKRRLKKQFEFIFGYCDVDNVLFVNIKYIIHHGKSKRLESLHSSIYDTIIVFSLSNQVDVMPTSLVKRIKLENQDILKTLYPKQLECTYCNHDDLIYIDYPRGSKKHETVYNVMVCRNCLMVYNFIERECAFVPLISDIEVNGIHYIIKPIKIDASRLRKNDQITKKKKTRKNKKTKKTKSTKNNWFLEEHLYENFAD